MEYPQSLEVEVTAQDIADGSPALHTGIRRGPARPVVHLHRRKDTMKYLLFAALLAFTAIAARIATALVGADEELATWWNEVHNG